jgi:hypothetical protein
MLDHDGPRTLRAGGRYRRAFSHLLSLGIVTVRDGAATVDASLRRTLSHGYWSNERRIERELDRMQR